MDKLEITQVIYYASYYYDKLQRGNRNPNIKLVHLPSDIRKSVVIDKLHDTFYKVAWKG